MTAVIDIPSKDSLFSLFRHVSIRAKEGNSERFCLDHIQIKEDSIASTNGQVLHTVKGDFSEYIPGLYKAVHANTKRITLVESNPDKPFVDWEAYAPEFSKYLKVGYGSITPPHFQALYSLSDQKIYVNPDYLKEAFWGAENKVYFMDESERGEGLKPILIETLDIQGDREYKIESLIMPMDIQIAQVENI